MKLTSIEAIRYGGLENGCLTGLGDGLTVVLGPNESGKSTFTALTRHVLYGYPDKRTAERRYEPAAGGRHGRLLFADESGEWVVERTEGPKGGSVSVQALRGAERPALLSEITTGVSPQTFKVVFGFGLDELDDIEQGDTSEIVARLYAAGTGLAVNPIDVRAKLRARADELQTQVKSTRRANTIAQRLREAKERINELASKAADFSVDQRRMEELLHELEPLKAERDELEAEVAGLVAALQRARDAGARAMKQADDVAEIESRLEAIRRSVEALAVDDAALAAAPVAGAVLDELSGYRRRLEAISAADAEAAEARRQAASLGSLPAAAADSAEARAAVERWRDRLMESRAHARNTVQAAEAAETRAEKTAEVSAEASAQANAAAVPAARSTTVTIGWAMVAVGIVAVAAGAATGQWIAVGLGVVVAVAGSVLALRKPVQTVAAPVLSDDRARLIAEARAARELANKAEAQLAADEREWREWLTAQSLDASGDDPVAVRALLDALARRDQLDAEASRAMAVAAREREAADAWAARLFQVAAGLGLAVPEQPSIDGALELAARVRQSVQQAVQADSERKQLLVQLDSLSAERERLERQQADTRSVLSELTERLGVDDDELVPMLESRSALAKERLGEVRGRVEAVAGEAERIRGRLDTEGRDAAMARARQEHEGLRAEAAKAVDGYIVSALAVHLLDRARERYERERQPEMIRTAARVFAEMTEGRYTDVRVPLDGTGISVIADGGHVYDTSKLSRGTAEQLYLALRVGLIGSLGQTGSALPILMDDVIVNFDPERRRGAAMAVSELASHRQVVFFTCHPDTAQVLSDAVEGAKVVELARCTR